MCRRQVVLFRLLSSLVFLYSGSEAFQPQPPHGRTPSLWNARALPSSRTTSRELSSPTDTTAPPRRNAQPESFGLLFSSPVRAIAVDEDTHRPGVVGKCKTLLQRRRRFLSPLFQRFQKFCSPRLRSSWLSMRLKRITLAIALWMMILHPFSALAVSGGRVGGGGFPSSSPAPRMRSAAAPSRSSGSMSHHNYHRPSSSMYRTRVQYIPSSPTIVPIFVPSRYNADSRIVVSNDSSRSLGVADIAILAGTGAVLAYGLRNSFNKDHEDTNYGNSNILVGSLTVTFSIPNRSDEFSLLEQIKRIATTADTVNGLKELVSDVCIALLRNMDRIECAYTESNVCKSMTTAQQMYQQKSVLIQSKFDRFVINKFGAMDKSPTTQHFHDDDDDDNDTKSRPTLGLVTIQYATTKESVQLLIKNNLLTRDDLRTALLELSSCNPQAAEVIWAPGRADELLDAETVYSRFPQLVPI